MALTANLHLAQVKEKIKLYFPIWGSMAYSRVNFTIRHCRERGTVGSGALLRAGRSRVQFLMVSSDLLIDINLTAALCSWGRLSLLTEMSTRNIPWR